MPTDAHRAHVLRRQGAVAVLRYVHEHPGATRADMVRALGLSSGAAADSTARLKRLHLLAESEAPPTGGRGRPSPRLTPHPEGPVVCAVDISHESWQLQVVELGGTVLWRQSGRHGSRRADAVLGQLGDLTAATDRRYRGRLGAVSVSVAGSVRGADVVQASGLRWREVSLEPLRPRPDLPLLAGNDATLAGLAEARRGAGKASRIVLHVILAVGVGAALVVDGDPAVGATGAGGEFGHLPFGDPAQLCPCGARGCWDLEVGGRAMARALGQPPPRNPRTRAEQIIAEAHADPAARSAVAATARALGRGIGGLVNALDPDVVTLSGLALELIRVTSADLDAGYRDALMTFHRSRPPSLVASALGPNSHLVGAIEMGVDEVLTPHGIEQWAAGQRPTRE